MASRRRLDRHILAGKNETLTDTALTATDPHPRRRITALDTEMSIEALRLGEEVWCVVRLHSGASGTRAMSTRDQSRYGTDATRDHIRF
jgi:hypothetical protein